MALIGGYGDAWRAADRALSLAKTPDERVIALIDMGDAHWSGGYWENARDTFQAAVNIVRSETVEDTYTRYVASSRLITTVFDRDQNALLLLRGFLARVADDGIAEAKARDLLAQLPKTSAPPRETVEWATGVLENQIRLWEKSAKDPEAQAPQNAKWLAEQLSVSLSQLAYLHAMQGNWVEAERLHVRELAIDRAREIQDRSVEAKQQLGATLLGLGDARLLQGKYGEAAENYWDALEIDVDLYRTDSKNIEYGTDYFASLLRIGALFFLIEDFEKAREYWTRAALTGKELSALAADARSDDMQLFAANVLLELLNGAVRRD